MTDETPTSRFAVDGRGRRKSTRLGLATVRHIESGHDGRIRVAAGAQKGAVFHVYLPGSDTPPQPSAKDPAE